MAKKTGMSYGELIEYEKCVNNIRKAAQGISKTVKSYIDDNGMLVSDGDIFANYVRSYISLMQTELRKINAYYKKYGKL